MKTPYDVILAPIISEKSMADAAEKKYTFKVATTATKTDIKDAVEKAFDVEVIRVNTSNFDGKLKRQGRFVGRTASYKKAIVTVSAASKPIEFFEGL